MDESKINSGFLDGLVKSKKLGLTASFASACMAILPTIASEIMQIALISAAVTTIAVYLISQAIVEAAWGHAAVETEEEVVGFQATAGTTTTLGPKQ